MICFLSVIHKFFYAQTSAKLDKNFQSYLSVCDVFKLSWPFEKF